ncbi:MAG: TolC family protein [Dysgonamonadaceae bacterium]|jgi:outer membrane protein TolC|nr:TolC family protein [Dysgonamonadaceae bacterium]
MSAQTKTIELTLDKTIEIASDSSLQAFKAKNIYQSSYWEFLSYKAARLPSLNLRMTPFQYSRHITSRYNSEEDIDIYRKQQTFSSFGNLSIRQNFDLTGGTFYIDSELEFRRIFGDNALTQFTAVPVRVGYIQDLFGFNSFKWEKRIEPLKYKKAKQQYLYNRESISETTTGYFFNLAMAQSEYDMAVENVLSGDTLYRIGEERHKIAAISQADLMTLKLDQLNAKNSLKNADIKLKRAMFSLVSFLNMEQDTEVKLILPDIPINIHIQEEEALQYANENNPYFIEYRQTVLEAEREVDRTQKASNFDASFSASIGFNQYADKFGDAYRNPSQQEIVSFTLNLPLVDWGVRKGRANMAKSNLNVTKLSVQQNELNMEQDVLMTVTDFNSQKDMILSAEEAMNLANMAYRNTKERFIIGKADINSLTLSLSRQKEAQKNYISALNEYWQSYYKIRKLTLFDFESGEPLSESFEKELNRGVKN